MFCREFYSRRVYAFFVLFFGGKKCACANFYTFRMSDYQVLNHCFEEKQRRTMFSEQCSASNANDRKIFSIADPDSLLLTQKRIEEIRQQRKDFKVEIVKKYNLV